MTLGFIILSFKEPDKQFVNLLEQLKSYSNSKIIVHHDSHQSNFSDELIDKFGLHLIDNPYRTYWSHINNVKATLVCLNLLFNSPGPPDWYITITPSCYPIKSLDKLFDFLNISQYDAFIEMRKLEIGKETLPVDRYILRDLYNQPFIKVPFISRYGKFYWKVIRNRIPENEIPFNNEYTLWHGSNWMMINAKVVRKLIQQNILNHSSIKFYEKWIKETPDQHPCPQEIILQSFIANQQDLSICLNHFRYINWDNVKDWSPNWLTLEHLDELKASDAFFARKFHPELSKGLIDKIDQELL